MPTVTEKIKGCKGNPTRYGKIITLNEQIEILKTLECHVAAKDFISEYQVGQSQNMMLNMQRRN